MTVRLQPLPHEFGLRINIVPKFMSVLWIAGWEISNTWRAKTKALREGEIVILSRVSVKLTWEGASAVGTGGLSQVITLKKEKVPEPKTKVTEPKTERNLFPTENERETQRRPNPARSSAPDWFSKAVREPDAWLDFTLTLSSVKDPVSKSEAVRLFMLFASGVISENQLRQRLRALRFTSSFSTIA